MATIISLFSKPTLEDSHFQPALAHLSKRKDVRLEFISLKKYLAMPCAERLRWAVMDAYVAWEEGDIVYRYVQG